MKKTWKKSILSVVACACVAVGALLIAPNVSTVTAAGGTLTVSDDFTVGGTESLDGVLTNVAYDTGNGNASYGAVPGSGWGGTVSGGDGSIAYTLKSESGYRISSANISIDYKLVGSDSIYWNNAYWQGEEVGNVLGTNLRIQYSVDGGATWNDAYNADIDENSPVKNNNVKVGEATKINGVVSLNNLDSAVLELQVKFLIDHFTGEETKVSSWATGIPLDRLGCCIYNTSITVTQADDEFTNSYRTWQLERKLGKDGNPTLAYTSNGEYAKMYLDRTVSKNGFQVSYDVYLGNTAGEFRMGLLGDSSYAVESTSGLYCKITSTGLTVYTGGNKSLRSITDIKDGTSTWYSLDYIWYMGFLTVKVNGTTVIDSAYTTAVTQETGYIIFQASAADDYITNLKVSDITPSEADLNDQIEFAKYANVWQGWNLANKDNNIILTPSQSWASTYYNVELTGNFELTFDVYMKAGIYTENERTFRIALMMENNLDSVEKPKKGYALWFQGDGILGSIEGSEKTQYFGGFACGGTKEGGTKTVYMKYQNGGLSVKVNNAVWFEGYVETGLATNGYLGFQSKFKDDTYIDNFKYTKLADTIETEIKATVGANQVLVGFKKSGGYVADYVAQTMNKAPDELLKPELNGTQVANIDGVTYEPVIVDMYMTKGASARIAEGGGLRWQTNITKDSYDKLVTLGAKFGTLITMEGSNQELPIPVENGLDTETNATVYSFVGALKNIKSDNYGYEFTGVGYIEITYTGDSEATRIEIASNDNARSYRQVVEAALNDVQATAEGKYTVEVTKVDGTTAYSAKPVAQYNYLKTVWETIKPQAQA